MSAEAFRRQLEALGAEYRAGLPGKLAEIDGLRRELAGGAARPACLADLRRALHAIAGSARTFGVAGLSEAASAAEAFIDPFVEGRRRPGPAQQAELGRLLDELKRAAA